MAYSEKVIEHYEHPRNVGTLDKDDPNVGTGLVGAPACGDVMKLQLRVNEAGIIEDAKFKTFGCGSAIASSSLVTEWVKGKSIDEAFAIKNSQIAEELSLPPVKIHCSVLAEDAVKAAIYDYKLKKGLLTVDEVFAHDMAMAKANPVEGETEEQREARVRAAANDYATKHGKAA
jgi:nitrogen fixation NifU-like protein